MCRIAERRRGRELRNQAKETNREIEGPLIKHMELCNVAAAPRGVRSVLEGGRLPLSCGSFSCPPHPPVLEDSSFPPSVGWAAPEKRDCLPKVFMYVRRAFLERFMLTVT